MSFSQRKSDIRVLMLDSNLKDKFPPDVPKEMRYARKSAIRVSLQLSALRSDRRT